MASKVLQRTMFEVSRVLEYFTERELTYQTGHSKESWPLVILKELLDNALDACENAEIAPEIKVDLISQGRDWVVSVEDNGLGIKPETITKILNFLTRTSDKEAYVSPTRGSQGNALKTIFAIPYVLNESIPPSGRCEIESCGIKHTIEVKLDRVKQEPKIEHIQEEIVKKQGTCITVRLENTSILGSIEKSRFLQMLFNYHLFNPHLSLNVETNFPKYENSDEAIRLQYAATNKEWFKWKPNDPTSSFWYDDGDLAKLISCHIAMSENGQRDLTLREFVSQFRCLSATAKQKQVTSQFPKVKRLSDFIADSDIDSSLVKQLLLAMNSLSKPVSPHYLGVVGEEHFKAVFQGRDMKYIKKVGSNNNLPFVVEAAYIPDEELECVEYHLGLNFAPAAEDPLQGKSLQKETRRSEFEGQGIIGLAQSFRVGHWDKVHIICHMAYPRMRFKDRGKSILQFEEQTRHNKEYEGDEEDEE